MPEHDDNREIRIIKNIKDVTDDQLVDMIHNTAHAFIAACEEFTCRQSTFGMSDNASVTGLAVRSLMDAFDCEEKAQQDAEEAGLND